MSHHPPIGAHLLHVIVPLTNPMMWERRSHLARRFLKHMTDSGVGSVTVIETQYGERPFEFSNIPGVRHIPTRADTIAWSKESAVNVGIRALPDDARYVAWIDADIEFRDPEWAVKTVQQLQLFPVVQPWSEALDLGPKGEVMLAANRHVQTSFGWVYRTTGRVTGWWNSTVYHYPHSGYAWAARMDFLHRVGGLIDFSGLGAADHQMSLGMVGEIAGACDNLSTDSYKAAVAGWGNRAFRLTAGNVGYVPGRIEHFWHGEKKLRKYVERWDILNRHKFDPHTDLYRNRWGILELSDHKPQLLRDVFRYFEQRNEDANCRTEV